MATALSDDVEVTIRQYMPIVYRYVDRYRGLMERDDLVSIGMAGLYKATQVYKGTCAFATTAHKCVQGAIVDAIRSCRGRTGLKVLNTVSISVLMEEEEYGNQIKEICNADHIRIGSSDDTEGEAIQSIGDSNIRAVVALLPPPKSHIIDLYYFQGYNLRETAFMLELPAAKVGVMHQEALEQLRGLLTKADYNLQAPNGRRKLTG